MPFTLSHPAIVLPFSKIRHASVSMSGLIIGSMAPDFEYFVRMKSSGRYGHTFEGIFFLDLPLAILVAIVFHQLVKKPIINSSPNYFYARLIELRDFNFLVYLRNHAFVFLGCVLTGIFSHIAWDSFTHPDEYFTNSIPYLSETVSIAGFQELPIYRILQHVSTAIGAFFIALVFHRQPVHQTENTISFQFWIVAILVACVTFAIRAPLTFEYFADVVATIVSSGVVGLIVSSTYLLFNNK